MSKPVLTPALFKDRKPQFASVDDDIVQGYIDAAVRFVDGGWPDPDYINAWIAAACHLMTLDGLGTDAISQANASGASEYQTVKSGELTLTRGRSSSSSSDPAWAWWQSTPCGRYYAMLLRLNRHGAVGVSVARGACVSPYAKDLPILNKWRP